MADGSHVPAPASPDVNVLPYPCQTPLRTVSLENTRAARKAFLMEKIRRDKAAGVPPFSFNTYPDLHVEVSDAFRAEKNRIENELLPEVWKCVMDLQRNNLGYLNQRMTDPQLRSGWQRHHYTDKGGDMLLFTRPRIDNYHFARASFTVRNVSPLTVLTNMHAQSLPKRQQYSRLIAEYHVLERNPAIYEKYIVEHERMHEMRKDAAREEVPAGAQSLSSDEDACSPRRPVSQLFNDNEHLVEMALNGERNWYVEYNRFHAPPPVAHRDITMLMEKKYDPMEDCYYVYGCSIDFANFPEHDEVEKVRYLKQHGRSMYCVDGIIMFCWQLLPTGTDTVCTYTNVMNPSGWLPPTLVAWCKGEVPRELSAARKSLHAEMAVVSPFTKRLVAMLRGQNTNSSSESSGSGGTDSRTQDPAVLAALILAQREAERASTEEGTTTASTALAEIEAVRRRLRDTVTGEREAVLKESVPSWLSRYFTSSKADSAQGEQEEATDRWDAVAIEQQLLEGASALTAVEREGLLQHRRAGTAVGSSQSVPAVVSVLTMTVEDTRAAATFEEEVIGCGELVGEGTPTMNKGVGEEGRPRSKAVVSIGSSGPTPSELSHSLAEVADGVDESSEPRCGTAHRPGDVL